MAQLHERTVNQIQHQADFEFLLGSVEFASKLA